MNPVRKSLLWLVGLLYIVIGLLGLASPVPAWFFVASKSYNIFLVIMGLMSLGAADLGGDEAKWFDLIFGLVLIVLTAIGSWDLLYRGGTPLGHVLFNGLMAIILLYVGLIINHRLKHQQK